MGTSRRTQATESVRERIKQYIVDHNLTPGASMPTELVLCEELGVSRSSIREAIRQLDALDIVDVQHGRGTFVGKVSLAPLVDSVTFRCTIDQRGAAQVLREIVDVRRALDAGQASAVVNALSQGHHQSLHDLADAMIAKSGAGQEFSVEDRLFHTRLLDLTTGNVLARNLIAAFWDIHTHVIAEVDMPRPDELHQTAKAHKDMVEAAERGDEAAYLEAVNAHYAPLLNILERIPHNG
ncbi:FadR/GntR family transcriptional regulator [Luteococcus sp. OSA5]|uniref:FadR/GntR family transcriptional regulator n=1 Tax=Luteococcus sp. OSA5 TaxID=3401630 RepID=UPI003B42E7AC